MNGPKQHGGARKGAGRKPAEQAEATQPKSIRLKPSHWAKFQALGGIAWLRNLLDKTDKP